MKGWRRMNGNRLPTIALGRRNITLAGLAVSLCFLAPIGSGSGRERYPRESDAIPILAYHRFDPTRPGSTTITVPVFEAQLRWLAEHGYQVIGLHDAVAALRDPPAGGMRRAVITIDDGHRSVYATLFPLIRKHRTPVTLFIYPSAISNADYAMTWDQLREMQASGLVDIQSHTLWHPNFNAERRRRSAASYQAFVDDQLQRSKSTIEARLHNKVDMLAWPFGIVDAELEAAARKAGYTAALAYEGGPAAAGANLFALPRVPVGDLDRGARFAALIDDTIAEARP